MGVLADLVDVRVEVAPLSYPSEEATFWTDISRFCRGIDARRGSQRELGRSEAGTTRMLIENLDRRFDPKVGGLNHLALDGAAGAHASCPANTRFDVGSQSLDIRFMLRPDDYTPAADGFLASQFVFDFYHSSTGNLVFEHRDISGFAHTATSTVEAIVIGSGIPLWRVVLTPGTGPGGEWQVKFYEGGVFNVSGVPAEEMRKALTALDSDDGWTQLGDTITGSGASVDVAAAGSTALHVGSDAADPLSGATNFAGRIYAMQMRVADEVVAFPKFLDSIEWKAVAAGATPDHSVDSEQNLWTLGATASVVEEEVGSLVVPMTPVRATAIHDGITYPLFYGYVDGWDQGWPAGTDAVMDVACTDGFKVLANHALPDSAWQFEVRSEDPDLWFRLSDPEQSQQAANAVDLDQDSWGTYFPLARPPTRADGLNRYDPDGSMFVNPLDAIEIANERRGQYVQVPLDDFGPPWTLTCVMMADRSSVETDVSTTQFNVDRFFLGIDAGIGQNSPSDPGEQIFFLAVKTADNNGTPGVPNSPSQVGQLYFRYNEQTDVGFDSTITNSDSHALVDLLDRRPHIITVKHTGRYVRVFVDGVLKEDVDTWTTSPGTERVHTFASGELYIGSQPRFAYQFTTKELETPPVLQQSPFWGWVDEVWLKRAEISDARIIAIHETFTDPWKGDTSSERLTRVLDSISWPDAARNINVGDSALGRAASFGGRALDYLGEVTGSEMGRLFMSRDGKLTFLNRHAVYQPPLETVAATFGDASPELPYLDLKLTYDDSGIVNDAIVIAAEGFPQRTEDGTVDPPAGSQGRYLRRAVKVETMHDRDSEAKALSEWLVHRNKDAFQRIHEIRVRPQADADAMFPVVLSLDVGNRIVIRRRPPPDNVAFEEEAIVEGMRHVVTPSSWETTYWLSSAEQADVLTLDHATRATLGDWRSPL